ncbi:MAG TPA: hypothetical protein DIU39_08955 [Flavobacteriales bacterium]|nr:hypothetical protein [Flavobacteriales bacterium]
MIYFIKKYYKQLLLVLIGFFYLNNTFFFSRWKNHDIINHDVIFYYSYLPATFIYHDPTFSFVDSLPQNFEGRIWYLTTEENKRVPKMSIGVAVLQTPFFLLAHIFAKIADIPANGYSWPYEMFIALGTVFYTLLAFWFMMKWLELYFSKPVIVFTIIAVAFGTNLLHYATYEVGMSHPYSLFLFALFVWLTEKWHRTNYRLKFTFLLALVLGLITIVRPVNQIIALLPLLYGVSGFTDLKYQLLDIFGNFKLIFTAIAGFILPVSLQLIFWKIGTGHWIYYSYQNEGFFFSHPHIIDGLFSYRKGWLVYTPIMIFALLGMFFTRKYACEWSINIPLWLMVHIYIIYSWWCWWYGGSFGSRPMIETYAVLSLPFAAFLSYIGKSCRICKISFALIFTGLIALNIFQTKQYRITLIHWDSMTKRAYWSVFLQEQFPPCYDQLIQPPDYGKALKGEEEYD